MNNVQSIKFRKITDYIPSFIAHLSDRRYSEKTIEAYAADLSKFSQFFDNDYSTDTVELFITSLVDKGYAVSHIRRIIATCQSFFNFLNRVVGIFPNPFIGANLPRAESVLPVAPSQDIVFSILNSIDRSTFLGLRDYTLITFLFGTGARISEALSVRLSDIDFEKREIIVFGKGNKERKLVFPEFVKSALEDYLHSRVAYATFPYADILFFTVNGDPLTYRAALRIIEKRSNAVGIGLTCHNFRSGFATTVLEKTNNIAVVQELLGHADPKTTMRYCSVSVIRLHDAVDSSFQGETDGL